MEEVIIAEVRPTPQGAINYHIEGELPVQLSTDNEQLSPDPYNCLLENVNLVPNVLRQSYSGLCLAGRVTGKQKTQEIYSNVQFRHVSSDYGLNKLLTIHGWSDVNLSRVAFYNPRNQSLDRYNTSINLVVCDGDKSFLSVIGHQKFLRSDIIGIVPRNIERDRLEAVGGKMLPDQWYLADTDMLCELPPLPKGISIAIFKERGR